MTNTQNPTDSMSKLLPYDLRHALAAAARTPVPISDPRARVRAIEAAMEMARAAWPTLFRKD